MLKRTENEGSRRRLLSSRGAGMLGDGGRALSRSSSGELDWDVDAGESRSASAVELSVKVYVLYSG